ncbi:MAG: M1 family aminopeptidase, partial [Caldilineaceae bacterium]
KDAIGALRIFSDRYGAYPFQDMRVAPAPISFRGMEYPQVSLLGIQLYSTYRNNLEILTAHEVAHQWWYQLVHNDPVNSPWLDEAIAEFSMKLYMDSLRGEDAADFLLYQRWQIPVEGIQADELDVAINQPVLNFASGRQYETIVYGKGALFYDAMRDRLGDRRFNRFWQDFLAAHRYGIVTEQDWLAAIKALDDPELVRLYERWVNGPRLSPTPVPSPTPAEGD